LFIVPSPQHPFLSQALLLRVLLSRQRQTLKRRRPDCYPPLFFPATGRLPPVLPPLGFFNILFKRAFFWPPKVLPNNIAMVPLFLFLRRLLLLRAGYHPLSLFLASNSKGPVGTLSSGARLPNWLPGLIRGLPLCDWALFSFPPNPLCFFLVPLFEVKKRVSSYRWLVFPLVRFSFFTLVLGSPLSAPSLHVVRLMIPL